MSDGRVKALAAALVAGRGEGEAAFRSLLHTPYEGVACDVLADALTGERAPAEGLCVLLGQTLLRRGESTRVLALPWPELASLWALRAQAYERLGQQAASQQAWAKVARMEPGYPGLEHRLALTAGADAHAGQAQKPEVQLLEQTLHPELGEGFAIQEQVAAGGSARVFRAEDILLKRRLALKVWYQPSDACLHEARITHRMAGPGVPRVFDVDPHAGWLALEWVGGGPLEGYAPKAEFSGLIVQVILVLRRAHRLGLVHGDLKPSNLLCSQSGAAQVIDWAAAGPIGSKAEALSPAFSRPERLAGAALSPHDDWFGLGECLQHWQADQAGDLQDAGRLLQNGPSAAQLDSLVLALNSPPPRSF